MSRSVYLDHSATTPVDHDVLEAMMPYFTSDFGNPNSLHAWGRKARKALDEARNRVAQLINADPTEVFYRRWQRSRQPCNKRYSLRAKR